MQSQKQSTKLLVSLLLPAFFLVMSIMAGCASVQFEPQFVKKTDLEWPPKPSPVKVEYIGELKEFRQTNHTLGSILTGKNQTGKIRSPVSVAVGKDGRIAIADTKSRGVHFYVPAEKKYKLIYRTKGISLQSPVNVTFDKALNLYVSDSTLRKVLIYDLNGTIIKELDRAEHNLFGRPTGLSIDEQTGQLYVVDTLQHKIHVFDGQQKYLYSFGNKGSGQGEFNLPTHLHLDTTGRLFINDTMNFRLQIYEPARGFVSMFGHHGNGSGDFAMPKGVGVDRWGVVYVVDSLFDCIQLFDDKGTFLLTVGGKGVDAGNFWLPSGLFIDHDNKMYVCDTYNKRIQLFQLFENKS